VLEQMQQKGAELMRVTIESAALVAEQEIARAA